MSHMIAVDEETLNDVAVLKESQGLSSNKKAIRFLLDFYDEMEDKLEECGKPAVGKKGFWEELFGDDDE
jgi:hypothetical protein